MSYYAIGIGGTGAKCLEALIHLCSAGLLPGDLTIIFIDPDKSNGCLERAAQTVKLYQNIKTKINFGASDIFETSVTIPEPDIWSPFEDDVNPRLDNFFVKASLDQVSSDLFDVLYTQKEQETTLEKGFRGHPSIGSAIFADKVDLGAGEPWSSFKNKIAIDLNGGEGRIFLFGSIFGGTGASGFPTIATLIRNELKKLGMPPDASNMRLGGALMLPYFTFNSHNDSELKARAEEFLVNSQAALKYYYKRYESDANNFFDALYLLGDQSPQQFDNKKTSLGGATQRNAPHFVELYAALAALHFFRRTLFNTKRSVHLISRNKDNVSWADLPQITDSPKEPTCRNKLGQMTKFSFAYLHQYFPVLESIRNNGAGISEPWFIDFIRNNLAESDLNFHWNELQMLKDYCELFLRWIASMQLDPRVEFVEARAFSSAGSDEVEIKKGVHFDPVSYLNLILPSDYGTTKNDKMIKLLEQMCCAYPGDESSSSVIGNFISTLHSKCLEKARS